MNKLYLIKHFSLKKSLLNDNKYIIYNKVIDIIKIYFNAIKIDLINLSILDKINNFCYWTICNNTGNIYLIKIYIDSNKNINIDDSYLQKTLYDINKYTYNIINIKLIQTLNRNNSFNIMGKKYAINSCIMTQNCIRGNILGRSIISGKDINILIKNKNIINNDSIKKYKLKEKIGVNWNHMVSASSIRNYLLNDPLLDYLKKYNISSIYSIPTTNNILSEISQSSKIDIFTKYILDSGVNFENELIKLINLKHPIIKIGEELVDCYNTSKFNETIEYMSKGVPIIYQGILHNYQNYTYGIPDLLVRSDYINILFGYDVISFEEAHIPSPNLNTPYHYKVIDIKHSNIHLSSDGIYVLNKNSIPAYKGQLLIYLDCLNKVQGLDNIKKTFIWGKKYIYESKGNKYIINNFLNKVGIIDYNTYDFKYIELTNNAIQWIRDLRTDGKYWKLFPFPSRKELFPNMKNEKDGNYRSIKLELADKLKEITSLWYCSIKNRNLIHSNNIFSWNDIKCTSKTLGFSDSSIGNTIDKILSINRQHKDLILPKKVEYNRSIWIKKPKNTMIFYLDFETLNSMTENVIEDNKINYNNNQYIFMIGIGYQNKNKQWIYKNFIINNKTYQNEKIMFNKFFTYIKQILNEYKMNKAQFYHWSKAEPNSYNNFKNKHFITKLECINFSFYDLSDVFINEPIVIKGVLNFSLKNIAKTMNKYKFIKSNWHINSICNNGLSAMILANSLYENKKNSNININKEPIMQDIIKYNEIDCRVLYEIHQYLKKNM
jgi:hypothetical protein